MSGLDVRLMTRLHSSQATPAAGDPDGWALLGALAGPRIYLSAGRRFPTALDRAFCEVWRRDGPTQARKLIGAGWAGWSGIACGSLRDRLEAVEAFALSPSIVVGLIPITVHDGPLEQVYSRVDYVTGAPPSTEIVFCHDLG